MKPIAVQRSLLALAALLVLLFNAACSRTPADRIERVLNDCARISKEASAMGRDAASTAGYLADHFQALDASGCPQDFRVAFQQHVNAWRQAQYAYANNSAVNNVIEGAVAAVAENPAMIGAAAGAAAQASQDINSTYYQLTAVAAAYGARIPRSVVE